VVERHDRRLHVSGLACGRANHLQPPLKRMMHGGQPGESIYARLRM
jgi:hypothetical protein